MAPGTDEACVTHETLDAALEILNTPIEPEPDPEPGLQQHEMTGPRRAWLLSGPPRISESDREGEATIVDQLPEDSFAEHVRRRQERANPSVLALALGETAPDYKRRTKHRRYTRELVLNRSATFNLHRWFAETAVVAVSTVAVVLVLQRKRS